MLELLAVMLAFRFGDADRDHLRGVIPFVNRRRDVEALVTLEADQAPAQCGGQDLGNLGLADAGLAFEENRAAHFESEIKDRAERPVGQIVGFGQQIDGGIDRAGQRPRGRFVHAGNVIIAIEIVPLVRQILRAWQTGTNRVSIVQNGR